MYCEPTMCPECGKLTLESSTYVDYCTNCDYSFGYPSIHNARPGTVTDADIAHHPDFKE